MNANWDIDFISRDDLMHHVANTIEKYGDKLMPYDLDKFNKNLIDPVKAIFDKSVYRESWKEVVSNEIFRQRDKSNNNEIGYFHQRIFEYIDGCHVPQNGHEGGWDVIFSPAEDYQICDGNTVNKIYVEMKNKHNTMNSAAASKTYIKMQNQLLNDDSCACFLVEAIAKHSQNIVWQTTVDNQKVSHTRIRRVSIDEFYRIVTGEDDAFYKLCLALPTVIDKVIAKNETSLQMPHDTVYEELKRRASLYAEGDENMSMVMAVYMLGFGTYLGFSNLPTADENQCEYNRTGSEEPY